MKTLEQQKQELKELITKILYSDNEEEIAKLLGDLDAN